MPMKMNKSIKSEYEKNVEKLFESGRTRTYPKNQLIHYQGDPMSHVYIIKEGHVKAYTILESGDTRTILLLSPGDIFPIAFSTSASLGSSSNKPSNSRRTTCA